MLQTVVAYGDRALLVEAPDPTALTAVLAESPLPGQQELVPAARTVLVVLDRPPTDLDVAALRRLDPAAAPPRRGTAVVELEVVFDGADLDAVAELTGRSTHDVVAALTAVEFTVAFGGFAPGFGYLTGLPANLHVPRRSTPRTRVPAGSVALAGPYAGVYPQASPGGWQLIGHTDATLFDVHRDPPALLVPGAGVRLREGG